MVCRVSGRWSGSAGLSNKGVFPYCAFGCSINLSLKRIATRACLLFSHVRAHRERSVPVCTFVVQTFAIPTFAIPMFAIPIFAIPTFAIPTFAIPTFVIPTFAIPTFAIPTFAIPSSLDRES